MTKIHMLMGALASLALATPVAAQTVQFQSTPTSNTCGYPWVLTLQPAPTIQLAPHGAATVITKNVSGAQTPNGLFTPAANRVVPPGNLCFFEQCNAATITLTCASIGKGAAAKKPNGPGKFSVTFNAKKKAMKDAKESKEEAKEEKHEDKK